MIVHSFGPRDAACFGAWEPAHAPRLRRAVLLLQPAGWEYLRAHRAMQLLAKQLASAGCDVFRFDYAGTGDSWGDDDVQTLERWRQNVVDAADELQGLASVDRVSLVGLRLGARMAIEAAVGGEFTVERLVLWDATVFADDLLPTAMEGAASSWLDARDHDAMPSLMEPTAVLSALARSDAALRLEPSLPVLRVQSTNAPVAHDLDELPSELLSSEEPPCWVEERDFGAGAVPATLLAGITRWICT